MLPYHDSRLTRIILIGFFATLVAYAAYEIRGLVSGPVIEIENRVMEVSEPFIMIEGHAGRIAILTMNGQQIAVTEDGAFSEGYALTPGYNKIVLEARDRFGNTTERKIEIVYNPSSAPPSREATDGQSKASEGTPSTTTTAR